MQLVALIQTPIADTRWVFRHGGNDHYPGFSRLRPARLVQNRTQRRFADPPWPGWWHCWNRAHNGRVLTRQKKAHSQLNGQHLLTTSYSPEEIDCSGWARGRGKKGHEGSVHIESVFGFTHYATNGYLFMRAYAAAQMNNIDSHYSKHDLGRCVPNAGSFNPCLI